MTMTITITILIIKTLPDFIEYSSIKGSCLWARGLPARAPLPNVVAAPRWVLRLVLRV